MIYDFIDGVPREITKPTICIVGSGAMGLILAREFSFDPDVDVLLVEAGGEESKNINELETPLNSGDCASAVSGSFNQGFGGSTLNWGGQILPFCKLDFGPRPWIEKSEWPFDHNVLHEYYDRASTALDVDYLRFSTKPFLDCDDKADSFTSLEYGFSKWCPEPKLNLVFGTQIKTSTSVHLVVNACVKHIHTEQNSVSHITIVNHAGDQINLYPRYTIIAAGGIENARLLLRSAKVSQHFSAEALPALGRYYQDHIGYYGARMRPKNMRAFRNVFSTKLINGKKIQPKIFLSQQEQLSDQLLNVVANIGIEQNSISATTLIKQIYNASGILEKLRMMKRSAWKILLQLPEVISALYSFVVRKQIHIPSTGEFFLIANCESTPLSSSKISLVEQRDRYGFRKASIHWLLDDRSRVSMLHYFESVKRELERCEIAELEIKQDLRSDTDEWKKKCYSLYHHMGATRMGCSVLNSVVDINCQVHSTENLYIAGTSLLPTSSASNPTFTAFALAIRLADNLKMRLNEGVSRTSD
jgi:choline dehydrogenase-like flavoprotein